MINTLTRYFLSDLSANTPLRWINSYGPERIAYREALIEYMNILSAWCGDDMGKLAAGIELVQRTDHDHDTSFGHLIEAMYYHPEDHPVCHVSHSRQPSL